MQFLRCCYLIVLGFVILSITQDEVSGAKKGHHKNSTSLPRLMLTPYIKSGLLEEAKKESLIKWGRDSLEGIPSYTGFLTVNETTNSNLFFWFVPSMVEDPEDAPLMVWLNGPGTSSLFGLFVENGPFKVKKRGRIPKLVLRVRKDTWARGHNMLYIDSPVGTGFSYTDSEEGYVKNQDDIVRDLYTGLQQFYSLFPEFSKQQLYLAGEGNAAKTIPLLGVKIHTENNNPLENPTNNTTTRMNFKGIIIGSPTTDPPSLTSSYSEYFYHLGLIDDQGRNYMKTQQELAIKVNSEGKVLESAQIKRDLLFSPNSYLANVTGYENFASVLETRTHKKRDYYTRFLNQSSTRKLLHVGEQPFNNVSYRIFNDLQDDYYETSSKLELETLLNLKYRVLIYVGQMDMITPHVGVYNFIRSMNFEGKTEFEGSERRIIRDLKRGEVSGYVKAYNNLFYIVIRNAGAHAPADEPRWCREMVERFISGRSDEDF